MKIERREGLPFAEIYELKDVFTFDVCHQREGVREENAVERVWLQIKDQTFFTLTHLLHLVKAKAHAYAASSRCICINDDDGAGGPTFVFLTSSPGL